MIKVKAVFRNRISMSTSNQDLAAEELERFINSIGYENIRQILVNGQSNGPVYTVIYEE